MFRVSAFVAALLIPASAFAQVNLTVHNTGVNSSDVLVSPGAQTAYWTLLSAPPSASETVGQNAFRYYTGSYAADSATSAWVSMAASGNASVDGVYVYQLMVDLTGVNPATAVITGQFGTDNDGFIRVNGGPNAATQGFSGFGTLTNFTLNSGFVAGMNSIQVGANNGGNPTAFRVQFLSATAAPIPVPTMPDGFFLILVLTLVGTLVFTLRRRARAAVEAA
ncbi:MAG: hypothetical protein ABIP90_03160 [Vicinamibacterales bacterium]